MPQKVGGIPLVSTRFSLSVTNERVYMIRDSTAKSISRDRAKFIFLVYLTTSRINRQPLPVDPKYCN